MPSYLNDPVSQTYVSHTFYDGLSKGFTVMVRHMGGRRNLVGCSDKPVNFLL